MNRRESEEQMLAFPKTPEYQEKLKQLREAQAREDKRIESLRPVIDRIKLKTWLKIRAIKENPRLKYCL